MGSGVKAGEAYVEIFADMARLEKGLNQIKDQLDSFGRSVTNVGKDMLGLSAAMLAPVAAGTKVYADFEQQMAMVSTMLVKPQDSMTGFTRGIREMSAQFGESTETLSKGLYDILSAAIAPEKAMQVLGVAAKAARAGLADTAIAVDAITTVLNSYGLGAEKAADVSDWLFQVVNRGKLTFKDMAEDIGKTASLAHTAGLSLEEVGGFIATLTRNGVMSSQAMTGLNAVIKSFLKPSKEAAEMAGGLGLELSGVTLRTKGLYGVMQELSGLSPDTLARLFPDIDALKGILPAMNDMKGFAEDVKILADRAGSTETAYSKMANTMATDMARLKESGTQVFAALGEAVASTVRGGLNHVIEYVNGIRRWIESHQELIGLWSKSAVIIGAVGAVLVAVGAAIQGVALIFGGLATTVGIVASGLGFVVAGFVALYNPIAKVISAIVAVGVSALMSVPAVQQSVDYISSLFSGSWASIGNAAREAWAIIKGTFTGNVTGMGEHWRRFNYYLWSAWNVVDGSLTQAWYTLALLWDNRNRIMSEAWANLTAALQRLWYKATVYVSDVWGKFVASIPARWEWAKNALVRSWDGLGPKFKAARLNMQEDWDMFMKVIKAAWEEGRVWFDAGLATWKTAVKAMTGDSTQAWEQFCEGLPVVWDKTIGRIVGKMDDIRQGWKSLIRDITGGDATFDKLLAMADSLTGDTTTARTLGEQQRSSPRAAQVETLQLRLIEQLNKRIQPPIWSGPGGSFSNTEQSKADARAASAAESSLEILKKIESRVGKLALTFR